MNPEQTQVLDSYPRSRPLLPQRQRDVYEREYAINRASTGLLYRGVHRLEHWMHRKIAADRPAAAILELGAGGLNHIVVEHEWDRYDIVEPVEAVPAMFPQYAQVGRHFVTYDEFVAAAAAGKLEYDKILSVAVLEHLEELPMVVAASAVTLNVGGRFHAGIPVEGGLAWETAWRCSTGVAYRLRTGVSYVPMMNHEHINSAHDIEHVVSYFFNDVGRKRFPTRLKHISLYEHLVASQPNLDRCRGYLKDNGI